MQPAFNDADGEGAAEGGGGSAQALAALEVALCERHEQHISVLRCLGKSMVEGVSASAMMASVVRLYKQLAALFKWVQVAWAKPAPSAQLQKMLSQLQGDAGLGPTVYSFISFHSQQTAGEKVSDSKVKREATMVPKMVQEMEKFELVVLKLAKKSGVDLLRHMKKAHPPAHVAPPPPLAPPTSHPCHVPLAPPHPISPRSGGENPKP